MTMLQAQQQTIEVMIKGVTPKVATNGNEFLEVECQRAGRQFPDRFQCWDPRQLDRFTGRSNVNATLIINPQKVRPNKSDDGQFSSYYWEVTGEGEQSALEAFGNLESVGDIYPPLEDLPRDDGFVTPTATPPRAAPPSKPQGQQPPKKVEWGLQSVALREAVLGAQFLICHMEDVKKSISLMHENSDQSIVSIELNVPKYSDIVAALYRHHVELF